MRIVLIVLAALICGFVHGLRTGAAPTFIPEARLKTNYETSPLNWMGDAVKVHTMYTQEQQAIRQALDATQAELQKERDSGNALNLDVASFYNQKRTESDLSADWLNNLQDTKIKNLGLERLEPLLTAQKNSQEASILRLRARLKHLETIMPIVEARVLEYSYEKDQATRLLASNSRYAAWYKQEASLTETNYFDAKELRIGWTAGRNTLLTHNSEMGTETAALEASVSTSTLQHQFLQTGNNEVIETTDNKRLGLQNLEMNVAALKKSTTDLAASKATMLAHNQALVTHNAKLTSQIAAIQNERENIQAALDTNAQLRNKALLKADWFRQAAADIKVNHHHADASLNLRQAEQSSILLDLGLCQATRTQLLTDQADLKASYNALKDVRLNVIPQNPVDQNPAGHFSDYDQYI